MGVIPRLPRFDTTALEQPLDPEKRAELRRRRKSGEFGSFRRGLAPFLVIVVVMVFISVVNVLIGTFSAVVSAQSQSTWWSRLGPFGALMIGGGVVVLVSLLRHRSTGDWYQVAAMAERNGLSYRRASADPSYPGLLFGQGTARYATEHVYSPQELFADAGGYRYTIGSGKSRTTHHWNFAAFRLPAPMPHLVLDSVGNDRFGFSNLPVTFAAAQQVPVGAPVSDRYRLLAPEGYGQDALYLFPPDALADLMAAPAHYDIEIVDDWLFLYTKDRQDLSSPATWRMLEQLAQGLVSRVADLATRYRDGRLAALATPDDPGAGVTSGSPAVATSGQQYYVGATVHAGGPGAPIRGVAPRGQRLEGAFPWRTVLIVGVVGLAYFLVPFAVPFLTLR